MKKLLAAMIVLVLCIGLWSCGSKEQSQFVEATNQVVNFHGISFQIPAAWTMDVNDRDFIEYSDVKTGKFKHGLAATFYGDIKTDELLELRNYGNDSDNENGIDYKNYKQTIMTISNLDAARVEYYRIVKGQKYMYKEIFLQTDKGVINIAFFSTDLIGLEDFDKVADTISAE